MKADKDSSIRSRKKLAETTKSFRKLPDPDKLATMGSLLRAYQEEIDSLTKRAKYSENALFTLYKSLYAAPDPVPSLEAACGSNTGDLEDENRKLKREISEYEYEFKSLKNQEITIRKLEKELVAMDSSLDDVVHQQVEDKCKDLEEQLQLKSSEFDQQKLDLERQLESTRLELRDAFTRMDASSATTWPSRHSMRRWK